MKYSVRLLLLALLVTVASGPAVASPTSPAAASTQTSSPPQQQATEEGGTITGWELIQDNPHTGEWHVYLSNQGMAAMNKKMGCTLVTKAPEWNVVMFNDKTKVYFLSPLSEWKGAQSSLKNSAKSRQAYSRATTSLIEKPPKKLKDENILGHKTSLYLTDNLVTTGLKKVEFSITPEIEAPDQLRQVFGKIYGVGLTKLKGLPLKVSYIDENGKRSPVFETRKMDKKEIARKIFTHPSDYKRVDSEIAVLMDEKGREAMASIMDDLGEGDEGQDLDTLLDEQPTKTSSRKKAAAAAEDELGGDSSTSSSNPEAPAKDNEGWVDMIIPTSVVLGCCGIIGGAAFFFLRKK